MIGGLAGPPGYGVLDILHRDPATGDLTEVACLSSDGTDNHTGASHACLPTAGLLGGGAVAVSPDGAFVYTGSSASAAILAFRRDPVTGLLTPHRLPAAHAPAQQRLLDGQRLRRHRRARRQPRR